jgi:outer membrane protein assembly factor BamB/orotate phosphoribosyltransferase
MDITKSQGSGPPSANSAEEAQRPAAAPLDSKAHLRLRDGVLNVALKLGRGVDHDGSPYKWMVDTRELLLTQPFLKLAAALLWRRLKPHGPEAVGGMTLAGNLLTAAILCEALAEDYPLQGFLIRRERKGNGLRKLVEGPELRTGTRVVLVDDMVNSGTTQRQALEALAPHRVDVLAIGTLFDAERSGGQWLGGRGIAVEALFTLAELGIVPPSIARRESAVAWRWGPLNGGTHTAPHSTPAVTPERIIVGSDRGYVLGLSHEGQEMWRFVTRSCRNGVHSSPAISDGHAFIGAYDGFLYCLDSRSGVLVWERRVGQWIGSSPCLDSAGQRVFVGFERGEASGGVVALDAHTGGAVWRAPTHHYVHAGPVYDRVRNRVLAGCNDGNLYAFSDADGAVAWQYNTGGAIKATATIDDDLVFACSMDGSIHAVDARSGSAVWTRRLGLRAYFRPRVYGDLVVAGGTSGRVLGLERATGRIRWCAALGGAVVGGAALLPDGSLAIGSADGFLYVMDATTGRTLTTTCTGAAITCEPGAGAGLVLAPSRDGMLYAIEYSAPRSD